MTRLRLFLERLYTFVFFLGTVVSVVILLGTLALLIRSGAHVLSWNFLTTTWQHQDITQGGIAQAILGSLYLGITTLCISFPLGLATAIYLTEYSKDTWFKKIIELCIRNLAGIPSVIFGLFGLAVFVHMLGFGSSILAAAATLAAMSLPWVIVASTEALESVPARFRDSSIALGATRWQTIWKVVLPCAVPGCLTGAIISMARALGETAPIIVVGASFYLSGYPSSIFSQFMALPYHAFILATQHASPYAQDYAAGTALVLILLTLALSSVAIFARLFFRSKKVW